jgi:cytochrome c-type biogenesis protein CcmF
MIPELGEFALILALGFSFILAVVPLYGAATLNALWMDYAKPLAKAQFTFLLISFMCLAYAFAVGLNLLHPRETVVNSAKKD